MQFFRIVLMLAVMLCSQLVSFIPKAYAASPTGVVISHVIAGETNYSNAEFVALYNNTPNDVDATGYCVWSGSYTSAAIACVEIEPNTKVYIKAHNYLTIASSTFAANHTYIPDTSYPAANRITVGGDSVYVKDAMGTELDRVTWGSGKLATGGTLVRKEVADGSGTLVDTDATDLSDFTALTTLTYPPNASYDVVTIVDVCPNIADVQQAMPVGYLADEQGNCQPDSCTNLSGLQLSVPSGYDSDVAGICVQHDECSNVNGIQTAIPNTMIRGDGNDCDWDVQPLQLTEILPNAVGSDTGNEFIEIYNPTDRMIDLSLYSVVVGVNSDKVYAFPVGATIAPGEYRSFSDLVMKFTLVNTTGRVVLRAIDGSVLGDTGTYASPADGESWAFIDGMWAYTNQPTPAAANKASVVDELAVDTTDGLAPCPAGKYRNPLTNRCRTIETDANVLGACDEGQYRNPETGRCKKIVTTTLTPCKDGQYRSEETNRCRNIVTASVQKPCKDNQYRSEETNRCRNLTTTSVPDSAFAVQPVKDSAMAFVGWWALGGVGLLAVGYGVWEWRHELRAWMDQTISRFSGSK